MSPARKPKAAPAPAPLLPATTPRLVLKIGSSLLVDADGKLREDWLASVAEDVAAARAKGQQIVIVSSGSIALGARRLGLKKGGRASLEDAQAAAAVGQVALAAAWSRVLEAQGLKVAQILLTLDDLELRRRFLNASATIDRLLALGVVPVLNENDTVATGEIRFGDNDRLAARTAHAAGADGVLLLSDVAGLMTGNPKTDPKARLIRHVPAINAEIEAMASGGSGSGMGTGGMAAKLVAARMASAVGINLAIADGRAPHPLARHQSGEPCTIFSPRRSKKVKALGRKVWIAGRQRVNGRIIIDEGAVAAIRRSKSLLAAGVTAVEGKFARGDVVAVHGPEGPIGRGVIGYDATDARAIMGKRNDEQSEILGYAARAALIHSDHLVLL
ncbi:MAG: glutamate 5-kinase [Polymorphobacter sp.]|uniref:glutamate 5-kinase n=1 Tax=Polymorphobacter sp. TaxID=1909290 RepID=UPI003A873459